MGWCMRKGVPVYKTTKLQIMQFETSFKVSTVLDTDNLHFSEEFCEFPARTHADFPHDTVRIFRRTPRGRI